MGAYFDLEDEARIILEDYMPKSEDGDTCEGWYSFFTDASGRIVGSSDPNIIAVGEQSHLPKGHRKLKPGGSTSSYANIEGMTRPYSRPCPTAI